MDDWLDASMLDIEGINGDGNSNRSISDVSSENHGLEEMDMDGIILAPFPPPRPSRVLNIPIPLPADMNANCSRIVENVVYSLQRGENLLVECPSEEERRDGMLYGTLAYWHWKYEQRSPPGPSSESADPDVSGTPLPTKIFYATKSFKETDKVINSLNRIGSSDLLRGFKMTLLGSKEEMCQNEEVKTQDCVDNSCRWRLCNKNLSKPKRPTCPFYSRRQTETTPIIQRNIVGHKVLDIEDLRREGNHHCQYFDNVRTLRAGANFIVCPKEFLLSSILRQEFNINLKDSIVIFDDGSNLELECHRESSVHITAADLREACRCSSNIADSKSFQGIVRIDNIIANASQLRKRFEDFSSSLEKVLKWMREHGPGKPKPKKNAILEVLRTLYNECERNDEESMTKILHEIMELSVNHSLPNLDSKIVTKTRKFLSVISYIFGNINLDATTNGDYCMRLLESDPSNLQDEDEDAEILLALTCGNPSVVFRPIEDDAATVIVASSVLAPLSPLQTELGLDFHETVEIRDYDVANRSTFFAYCDKGPNNVGLTLKFEDRDEDDVKREVGESILKICKRIPGGVVLVFHSEYYLKQLLAFWRSVANYDGPTLFSRLSAVKHIVSELEMKTDNDRERKRLLQRYRDLVSGNPEDDQAGALLITLARGKLNEAEGWNLSGVDARGIIHVSIPYGYQNGVDFIFARLQHFAHTEARDSTKTFEWNHQEAFRILNQSFGKVVQENDDWRIVIVLDKLMEARRPNFGTLVPAWVLQSGFHRFRDFNNMMSSLEDFVDSFPES